MESRVSPLLRPYLSLFLAVRTDQNRDISLLMDMVQDANQTVVRDEDYLSDCIYYFDRKKCEIKIAVPTTANIR